MLVKCMPEVRHIQTDSGHRIFFNFSTGPLLFSGYLNAPERTAAVLIIIQNRIYMKTGDLARYNERGELIHAGRVDFQVKIRGQLVDTTEIESTIVNYCTNKISNCLVTKVPDNDDLLVAYIISNDSQLNIDGIRNHCENYLRRYMIPSYFVILDKLPLNNNGKVDRKQLPIPTALHQTSTNVVQIDDQPTSYKSTINQRQN